ncbi:glycosyltransferase [Paracoccus sp. DMF-8]|uniref:glycosyltransferase n=1 Tax=Paracoccus sp. DMF-8 TaxID=3019445 RepID=UPI0023E81D01|nr:glycosyltransferase [Paracoccus sp. DMF-8]MDF3605440.1 glycosyltransferase [Paracoccus sp. DMF-8]
MQRATTDRDGSLLIYASVAVFRGPDGGLLLEDQACNGLRLWAEHFDRLIVIIPLAQGQPPQSWVPVEQGVGPSISRIEIVTLPQEWGLRGFLRAMPDARRKLREAISRADRMSFALGGLVGDWGAVGAWQAHRMGRPFCIWTDRVESEVVRYAARTAPRFKTRLKAGLTWVPMAWLERFLIRRATVGLFHGQETFEHYAPGCRNPQLVHDIHIRRDEHLPASEIDAKVAGVAAGPLRIVYVGRADAMKGARDWVESLIDAIRQGVDLRAEWLGAGPELDWMENRIREAGVADRITLRGMVRDREAVLQAIRQAQVFLFCHRTPESPRCLIEALVSATPIVGFDGAFARDLISGHGGGMMVPQGDRAALTAALVSLDRDRPRLARMIQSAHQDGAAFDDESVFRHRSDVIKRELPVSG